MRALSVARLLVALALFAPAAEAAPILITSAADPALAGSSLIDFNAEALGTFTSRTFSSAVTISSPTTLYIENDFSGFFGSSGAYFTNQDSLGAITFDFSSPISAFGFSWGAADQPWSLAVYDSSNVLLGTLPIGAQTDPHIGFVGADGNGSTIGRAVLTVNLVNQPYDYFLLDDLELVQAEQTAPVPEPATMTLLGLGLAGMAGRRWRQRKTS